MSEPIEQYDVLVVGSGIAGLSFALDVAQSARVALLTKRSLVDTNTRWAQGGFSAVIGADDSFELHAQDTLTAGAGLCRPDIVDMVVKGGPAAVAQLIERGVALDRDEAGHLELTREGGHSRRRVTHARDATGQAIQTALTAKIKAHPGVDIYENTHAIDLITRARISRGKGVGLAGSRDDRVLGVYALDTETGVVSALAAPVVCLATGGAGRAYVYTSNPKVATGDGVAMAYRAGASIANMEFFQFHPTLLYSAKRSSFLISEALRGEGGVLRNASGEAFMERYHPLKDLAPRDIVARAIDRELKTRGDTSVFLDMTHLSADFLEIHFPNIHETCMSAGVDMRTTPIPVVPGAHYMCGGVLVDRDGRSNLNGLYAIGEVSCTGLHGANRLASNSLLEGAVFAARAAVSVREFLATRPNVPRLDLPLWDIGDARSPDERVVMNHSWDEIRRLMWSYVGIVRSNRRLRRASRRLELLYSEVREEYWRFLPSADLIELRNLCMVAQLIVRSALMRQESRGLHYSLDYPESDDANWSHETVIRRPVYD